MNIGGLRATRGDDCLTCSDALNCRNCDKGNNKILCNYFTSTILQLKLNAVASHRYMNVPLSVTASTTSCSKTAGVTNGSRVELERLDS